MSAVQVRAAYRAVLRAQRAAFRGDIEMVAAAQRTARAEFDKSPAPDADANAEVEARLRDAHESVNFLRENIVQAPLNARGNYEVNAARIRTDK